MPPRPTASPRPSGWRTTPQPSGPGSWTSMPGGRTGWPRIWPRGSGRTPTTTPAPASSPPWPWRLLDRGHQVGGQQRPAGSSGAPPRSSRGRPYRPRAEPGSHRLVALPRSVAAIPLREDPWAIRLDSAPSESGIRAGRHGSPRGSPPAITRQHSGDLAGFGP